MRRVFLLLGKTIAGTTDSPTEVTHFPYPTEEDIRFILHEIRDYLSPDISGGKLILTHDWSLCLLPW